MQKRRQRRRVHTAHSIADIVAKSGITRTSLYRHPQPRASAQVTQAPTAVERQADHGRRAPGCGGARADPTWLTCAGSGTGSWT